MYVALDIQPNTPIQMVAPPGSPLQEIPAVPNTLEQAQAVAVRIFERLDKVDFNAVFTEMTAMLESIRQITTSPAIKQAMANSEKTREQLDHALAGAQQTLSTVNSQVPPLVELLAEDLKFGGRRRQAGAGDARHRANDDRAELSDQLPGAADAAGRLRRRALDQGAGGLPAA